MGEVALVDASTTDGESLEVNLDGGGLGPRPPDSIGADSVVCEKSPFE